MSPRPSIHESYGKDLDLLNFVVYRSTSVPGEDEVLQHKTHGVEMAHITLHPDGTVNLRERMPGSGRRLKGFVSSGLLGFTPRPSKRLETFLRRVRAKLPK